MGAAFSGGSLCRFVVGVEILVSSVIIGFGAQTLFRFTEMNDKLKTQFEWIQYSAITAIVQGTLTILASLILLIGTKEKAQLSYSTENEKDGLEDDNNMGAEVVSDRRGGRASTVLRLWLIFSIISIGLLVFVFVGSMDYCIQNEFDIEKRFNLTGGENGAAGESIIYVDGKKKIVPPCYAEHRETLNMRQAIGDLYSYSLVNIFALICFMFVIYSQLKRINRRDSAKRVPDDQLKCLPPQPPSSSTQEENNKSTDDPTTTTTTTTTTTQDCLHEKK